MNQLPADRTVFEHFIQVRPSDIDELNHVNNVVYVQWVQDVASAHWNSAAPESLRHSCQWVVLRHEIDYRSPALPGDQLVAYTWIDPPKGPVQNRHVHIFRAEDKKLLAHAITLWCLLDPNSGKPRRIPEEICERLGLKK